MARLFDDASTEYLAVASAVVATTPLSMACWFNSDNAAARNVLMCVGDTNAVNYQLLEANGTASGDPVAVWSNAGGAASSAVTTSGYTAGTWHHACGVFSADNARAVYIDGGSKGTESTNRAVSGLDTTAVGARYSNGAFDRYTSGMIAEAAVWSAALTDAEVAILALGVSPLLVRPESLVFYAPLIRDEDRDIVGGLALTAYNTPTIADHPRVYYPTPKLVVEYTESGGGSASEIAGVTWVNVGQFAGVAEANIAQVIGVVAN